MFRLNASGLDFLFHLVENNADKEALDTFFVGTIEPNAAMQFGSAVGQAVQYRGAPAFTKDLHPAAKSCVDAILSHIPADSEFENFEVWRPFKWTHPTIETCTAEISCVADYVYFSEPARVLEFKTTAKQKDVEEIYKTSLQWMAYAQAFAPCTVEYVYCIVSPERDKFIKCERIEPLALTFEFENHFNDCLSEIIEYLTPLYPNGNPKKTKY